MKKFTLLFFTFIFVAVVALFVTGNGHIIRGIGFTYCKGKTTANINDHNDFETRIIRAGETQEWQKDARYNQTPLSNELVQHLQKYRSVGFLVIKDGKLLNEKYFSPYNEHSKTNSFSMAKTILTMLVGAAIDDGTIGSFDDMLDKYIPELKGRADGVTLAHLSGMNAGLNWDESYYSPFSRTPKLLYGYNSEKFVLSLGFSRPPATRFYYASAETQILGVALKRALGEKSISDYLAKKFWQPLGMNDDGLWHTDAQGLELVFCCVSTNARNFAKFGQLLLQNGNWHGKQLLSEKFIARMKQNILVPYYAHSLWTDERDEKQKEFFLLRGHLGQFVIVVPEENLVIVRLGEISAPKPDEVTHFIPDEIYFFIEQAKQLAKVK